MFQIATIIIIIKIFKYLFDSSLKNIYNHVQMVVRTSQKNVGIWNLKKKCFKSKEVYTTIKIKKIISINIWKKNPLTYTRIKNAS